jgi:hypothetical protein
MKTYLLYYPLFWLGYWFFRVTHKTNKYAYIVFRKLFVSTRGKSNDHLSRQISRKKPPYALRQVRGVLGSLSQVDIGKIADRIGKNGFHVFDQKLAEVHIEALLKFARTFKAELIPPAADGTRCLVYDKDHPRAPRYQFAEKDVFTMPIVQQLAADPSLFAVAQAYLGCKPIQDLTAMWWSAAFSKKASSEAAQLFHFDMDRIKFIKFFFYLTDVDSHNGPHCYVRGSHAAMPASLWKDGRIQDEEIAKSFTPSDIMEITGSRGTIIAVDTRGLHKGKVLERGERLILQFEFTNSLFGAPYERVNVEDTLGLDIKEFFNQHSYSFQRLRQG